MPKNNKIKQIKDKMESIKEKFDLIQIKALLWRDFLIRIRQPWMTILQYMWPCGIFLSLYILRLRFGAQEIDSCQFPPRQLLTKNQLLPFFQSYICEIENKCLKTDEFQEVPNYENVVITPALNIVQIFLNEKTMYDAIIKIPIEKSVLSSVMTIATHPKFKQVEANAINIINRLPEIMKIVGETFNINKLWSDHDTFSHSGNIICGHPFPKNRNIRYVTEILQAEDYNGADDQEINSMPTKYCKQLYLDVAVNVGNFGKMTWKYIKPILQGKILYGPDTERNMEIVKYANTTYFEMNRLGDLIRSINTTFHLLHTNEEFKNKYLELIALARLPFAKEIVGDNVDIDLIESILLSLINDDRITNVVNVLASILDCFSVDRFVAVKTKKEFEDMAFELNEKRIYFGGVWFNDDDDNNNNKTTKDISYTIRMDIDNSPVTIENKNRFWFPGPEGSFELDMRYHRGFLQIQHAIDTGIIKTQKNTIPGFLDSQLAENVEEEKDDDDDDDDYDNYKTNDNDDSDTDLHKDINFSTEANDDQSTTEITISDNPNVSEESVTNPNLLHLIKTTFNITNPEIQFDGENGVNISSIEDILNLADVTPRYDDEESLNRTKRAPQFEGLLGLFLGQGKKIKKDIRYDFEDVKIYTKQFPYPQYTKDDFKKGLYLAQAVQMTFFIALIIQIASSVRHKIWMEESGNTMLMQSMGLKPYSECISWIITTFIELLIIFLITCVILYIGGILEYTGKCFIYFFLVIFGLCVISFCFMTSTFFSSASIGSVSSVILFLTTFLPYIIIISLGTTLNVGSKFIVNLSLSTAFCYAWHHIMRAELQEKEFSFVAGFSGSLKSNDFKFAFFMIIFDIILYIIIGCLYQRFKKDEFKFHKMNRKDLDSQTGAIMRNVTKTYNIEKSPAVNNVSLVLKRDYITCLLGRNGAGKSTIIKMLTGQTLPTNGEIYLPQSYDLITGINKQEQVGLCPQNNVLIPNLTAKEHLELYARIKMRYGFTFEVSRILEILNLGKYEHYRSEELSGGFKRRLCIANAFMGSPNLVILDEPCSGVDTKARKNIWELIETLRKGRAVILATHYLDEAEHLSDSVIMLNNGTIVSENTPETLKQEFTKSFLLKIGLNLKMDNEKLINDIKKILQTKLPTYNVVHITKKDITVEVPYIDYNNKRFDLNPMIASLEEYKMENKITYFKIMSKNLLDIFQTLNKIDEMLDLNEQEDHNSNGIKKPFKIDNVYPSQFDIIINLFWKRFVHYKRNYRLLLSSLVLPTLFVIIAMSFMTIRPHGDHENEILLSNKLYENSKEFYGFENGTEFVEKLYNIVTKHCEKDDCAKFDSLREANKWLVDTHEEYIERRYGGLLFNETKASVWYNNKGYHSMPSYLNELTSAILKVEMNDESYNIRTYNHPLALAEKELSASSILQQVSDAGIALILLIAFSLVIAGNSIYIVSERTNGEKLQQKLCGINYQTYWGVAFVWDFIIYMIALTLTIIIIVLFGFPMYVAKDNLGGIIVLLILFGFATIPAVHLFEKIFKDASFANMSIFCLNVVIALTTLSIILIMDILRNYNESDAFRNFLNRAFLIFPQHALADGLILICQNYIESDILSRFYINTYTSPYVLLKCHFIALFLLGLFFMFINFLIESGNIRKIFKLFTKTIKYNNELQIVSSQNELQKNGKINHRTQNTILTVRNLSKSYNRRRKNAVDNVSFEVKNAECFGLLGSNGAGKSTIFSILSGQLEQSAGTVEFFNNNGISYCPQNNPLDPLLTVEEIIKFYSNLKNIKNLNNVIEYTLKFYHLAPYKTTLVKNLSGGNRRKLTVAMACLGNSQLVLMDEPTSDMDPVTRSLVYKSIKMLISENRSVILTSHTISEIEKVCHRIAVLRDGKLISIGTPKDLKNMYGNCYSVTIFYDKIESLTIERDTRAEFPTAESILTHNHSLQFIIKIKSMTENNVEKDNEKIILSELLSKLHIFTSGRNILYTISECLMDQAFEYILETDKAAYTNGVYQQDETST